jgi:hypothetical protein
MNSASLPFLDTASNCSSILWSGVPVRTRISARNRPARSKPGSRRCESRDLAREQTLGVWMRGRGGLGREGDVLESRSGWSGSHASNTPARVVGSW